MEIRTFGISKGSFGELISIEAKDFPLQDFDYEETALIVVEDDDQETLCIIFNPDLARIRQNDILKERKDVIFTGSKGRLAWGFVSSYFQAEIFSARPIHIFGLLEIIQEEWKDVHKMKRKMMRYAKKYPSIKRYTEKYLPARCQTKQ